MNGRLEKAQYRFMEYISKVCDDFGLNKFIAELYAILYLDNRPMCLDEMTKRLGVSKGNVSLNIRELERWGAVSKVWIRGSRKDYYQAKQDIKTLLFGKVKSGIQKRLNDARLMIKEFNEILSSPSNEFNEEEKRLIKVYKEKLKDIERIVNLGDRLLKLTGTIIPGR